MKLIFYAFYRYVIFFIILWFILLKTNWISNNKYIIKISILAMLIILVIDTIINILKSESGIKTEKKLEVNISMNKNTNDDHQQDNITSMKEIVDDIIDTQDE